MKKAASQVCLTSAVLIAISSLASMALADELAVSGTKVRVELTDGKSFAADIDVRTNSERLVLRFSGDTSVLLRSIAWERVVTVVPAKPSDAEMVARRVIRRFNNSRQLTYSELAVKALAH